MSSFTVAYVPIGVPTFHLESAEQQFKLSIQVLKDLMPQVTVPDKMLLSMGDLQEYLNDIQPTAIILQNITFANAAYASEILHRFRCPLMLWTLREPVIDGGRLRLNSLTGAYSAANAMHGFGIKNFEYLFGSPEENEVKENLSAFIAAAKVQYDMAHLKMAAIGHTPQGFGFGRALDTELLSNFGVRLEAIEARELIDKAKGYSPEECEPYLAQTATCTKGLNSIPAQNQVDHARLCKAYFDYIQDNKIGAVASRCWPDFFTAFGTPVCTVLSMLNDSHVAAACEADIYGALSMYIGMQLTGKPTFFGDPVSLDEAESTVTYWHCGAAAPSLAQGTTGALVGVHPNRKIGPVMDFGCAPSKAVTVFRIGRKPDGGFRFFVVQGEALDKPKQFTGTSIVVRTNTPAKELVSKSVCDGWEPHFVVVYGDMAKELTMLCRMLGAELCRY